MVPVANVMAIYARETGQGMAFPPEEDEVSEDGDVPLMDDSEPDMESDEESSAERVVRLVPSRPKQRLPAKRMLLVRLRLQVAVRRSSV